MFYPKNCSKVKNSLGLNADVTTNWAPNPEVFITHQWLQLAQFCFFVLIILDPTWSNSSPDVHRICARIPQAFHLAAFGRSVTATKRVFWGALLSILVMFAMWKMHVEARWWFVNNMELLGPNEDVASYRRLWQFTQLGCPGSLWALQPSDFPALRMWESPCSVVEHMDYKDLMKWICVYIYIEM